MKKILICLLVLALLAGGVAGGIYWFRSAHVFVEEAIYPKDSEALDLRQQEISFDHYNELQSQLPDCYIVWNVPFQGGKLSSDTTSLTLNSLTEQDISLLTTYFPFLQSIDATGCSEYALVEQLQAVLPQCRVTWQIDLGGQPFAPDTAELILAEGEYDYALLMQNLPHLPQVASIHFPKTGLSAEDLDALTAAYPQIAVTYSVEVMGKEYAHDTEQMDLSAMTAADIPALSQSLSLLKNVKKAELMGSDGTSKLTMEEVKQLNEAAPGITFHYTFTLFGKTISTLDDAVTFTNDRNINDSQEAQIRLALDIMENCSKFTLDNCRVSNEICAKIREDYRDRTKFVWRVFFGDGGSCLTDREMIRAVYGVTDNNSVALKYCEDARYMDLGHNEALTNAEFVSYMPKLEAIIISGAPIKTLEPFAKCESLQFLEIAYCGYITDLSPLANCKNLKMLNISFVPVSDLSPLDDLTMEMMRCTHSKVSEEEFQRFKDGHEGCWSTNTGSDPYDVGWRRTEDGKSTEYYEKLRQVFDYDHATNTLW